MDKIPVPFSAEDKQRYVTLEDHESIDALIKELNSTYNFDYGTICEAIGVVAVLAAKKMNNSPQGGITGFQAGAVMWEFVKEWMHIDGPMKLVKFREMLYPHYDETFEKAIHPETWKWLQAEAQKMLDEHYHVLDSGHPNNIAESVTEHWLSIVKGVVPFGYIVKESF